MDERQCERNIRLYRLYVLFNEPLFWGPILIATVQGLAHMSVAEIYFMEAVVLCLCALLDIPSGALADVIGRKKTMIVGRLFLCASACGFTFMARPWHAWAANILWAIGYTMQCGADRAFLYDTLKGTGREREYAAIDGAAVGSRLFLMAWCSLITGYLASVNLRLPLLLGLPFILIPLIATALLEEPDRTEPYSAAEHLAVLKYGAALIRESAPVRWMVGFAALMATTAKVWFFMYNPYFEIVGLPLTQYGVVFFLLNVVAFVTSRYAYRIEARLGERHCVLLMVSCIAMPVLLMAAMPYTPSAYLVLVQNVVRGFMRPFAGAYINRHISSNIRATMLSVESSAATVASIATLTVFGGLIGHVGVLSSLAVLGLGTLFCGAWSYLSYIRHARRV